MFNALNKFRIDAAQGLVDTAEANVNETAKEIAKASANRGDGFGQVSEREMGLLQERLETQSQQYLNATKELQRLQALMDPAKGIEASGKAVPNKPLTQNTETEDEIKKAAAGKISVEDMLPRQVLADLELRVQNAINRVQNQINEALRNNNIEEVNRLRNEQALIPLRAEIDLLDAAAKAQEEYRQQQLARGASVVDIEKQIADVVNQLNIRQAELEGELRKQEEARIENLNEQKQLKAEQLQAFQTELTDLQLALDLELGHLRADARTDPASRSTRRDR